MQQEYQGGKQGAQGLQARWWSKPVHFILNKRLAEKYKWLESVEGVLQMQLKSQRVVVQQQGLLRLWLLN